MVIPSTLRIAWRNLGRSRRRTVLALTAIATAQLAVVVYQGILTAYSDWMVRAITGPLVGDVQVHAPGWREDQALDVYLTQVAAKLEAIRQDEAVAQASARVYAPVLAAVGEEGQAAVVLGVDLAAEAAQDGMLSAVSPQRLPGPGQVLVGAALARTMKISEGDQLAVVGQAVDGSVAAELFTVTGVPQTPVELVNRLGLVVPIEDARALFVLPDAAHELVVHARKAAAAGPLAARLASLEALAGTEVLPWEKVVPELADLIDVVDAYEMFVLMLVFVAAAAGVANTMMMSTYERTRELGMLLALGARPGRLVRMVLSEAVALGLLGLLVGTGLGLAAVLVSGRTGLDLSALGPRGGSAEISFGGLRVSMVMFPRVDAGNLLRGAVGVLATALLASLWPAARVARLEPTEAMRA